MRRAVALEPGLIMGHNLLAKIYIGQGRFAKAEGHLRKALELEQGSWEALIQLLFVLHRTGQLAPQGAGGEVSQAICERIRALLRQQGVREEPEALGLCAFFDPALWQRPLRADASVAARMRAHKYVALAEILPLDTVRALQAYYRKIIRTQYKACVCTHVYQCICAHGVACAACICTQAYYRKIIPTQYRVLRTATPSRCRHALGAAAAGRCRVSGLGCRVQGLRPRP